MISCTSQPSVCGAAIYRPHLFVLMEKYCTKFERWRSLESLVLLFYSWQTSIIQQCDLTYLITEVSYTFRTYQNTTHAIFCRSQRQSWEAQTDSDVLFFFKNLFLSRMCKPAAGKLLNRKIKVETHIRNRVQSVCVDDYRGRTRLLERQRRKGGREKRVRLLTQRETPRLCPTFHKCIPGISLSISVSSTI